MTYGERNLNYTLHVTYIILCVFFPTLNTKPPKAETRRSAACCFARPLPACKYMHVAAPSLSSTDIHLFFLAALAAITGMTRPNVARRSADHDENLPARSPPPSDTAEAKKKM